MLDFQRDYWETRLRFPDWYSRLEDELTSLFFPIVHDDPRLKAFRNQVYALIAELLARKAPGGDRARPGYGKTAR